MKLAPKHFRLLFLIQERGSVPTNMKPVVLATLIQLRLVEFFHGEEWLKMDARYRLTARGKKVISACSARIELEQQRVKYLENAKCAKKRTRT